jgi:hypothetical protein
MKFVIIDIKNRNEMLLTEVNITQNNRQTPILGGSDIFADIFLFFVSEYLHFLDIILHTHRTACM